MSTFEQRQYFLSQLNVAEFNTNSVLSDQRFAKDTDGYKYLEEAREKLRAAIFWIEKESA